MIREKLNSNPKVSVAIVSVAVLACVAIAWATFRPVHLQAPLRQFYTTDDSSQDAALAALFVDEGTHLPPFDHDGKPAYLAMVYSADGGRTKFIGYLQRYTPKGKQIMEDLASGKTQATPEAADGIAMRVAIKETEVKKPGDAEWVVAGDPSKSRSVTNVTPPDGQDAAQLKLVVP